MRDPAAVGLMLGVLSRNQGLQVAAYTDSPRGMVCVSIRGDWQSLISAQHIQHEAGSLIPYAACAQWCSVLQVA